MTPKFFHACIKRLSHAYTNTFVLNDKDAMDTWWLFLEPYTDEKVAAAVIHMIRTVKAFPSVAHLVEYIEASEKNGFDQAWKEACQKAPALLKPPFYANQYHPPIFDDPTVKVTLEALGVEAFCHRESRDETSWRAQFRNFYQEAQGREALQQIFKAAELNAGTSVDPVALLMTSFEQRQRNIKALPKAQDYAS